MEKRNEKLLIALLGGAMVGAVLAVLFAPSKGSDLRVKIADEAGGLKDLLLEKIDEVNGVLETISGFYKEVKSR